jgi:hypothetical protein
MMFTDVSNKQVGQFVGLYEDKVVSFGGAMTFRVIAYAAERAGAICPEYNGIAVLRDSGLKSRKKASKGEPVYTVIASRLAQSSSGYYGISGKQKQMFDALCAANFKEFQELINTKIHAVSA